MKFSVSTRWMDFPEAHHRPGLAMRPSIGNVAPTPKVIEVIIANTTEFATPIVGCRHGESRFRQIIGVIEIPVIPVKLNAFVLLKSHYSKHQTPAASWEDAMISLKIL